VGAAVNDPGRQHAISDRLVAEVHRLHLEVEMQLAATRPWSGLAARRRVRDARYAETDLLRVLGFASYDELVGVVGLPVLSAPSREVPPVAPAVAVEIPPIAAPRPVPIERPRPMSSPPPAPRPPPRVPPRVPPTDAERERERARIRELERALGAAMAEIEDLRARLTNGQASTRADVAADAVAVPDADVAAAHSFAADLERATAELEALRATVREIHEMAVQTAAELIVAKLEILVAAKRAGVFPGPS
jgi:hypothetical protein